jgi:hypothetical protein
MRFLIGIFTGAVVTLLVATAMDAPTDPIVSNARDLASNGWDRLINATSNSLFEPVQDPTAAERAAEDEPEPAEPTESQHDVPAQDETPASAHPLETVLSATAPDNAPVEDVYAALEPAPALPAPEPVAESPSFEAWVEAALAMESSSNANQPVWVPFHSQMSAEGFAARLSRSLDHEFRVVRQGAGAYQVVFDAANADERSLILAQVTEITGR